MAECSSNALEAEGLALVKHALGVDGRLTLVKCFEGARADFAVHSGDPDRALGVQLKTTRFAKKCSPGSAQYRFTCTRGYDGLALLCIALDSKIRMWLMPGSAASNSVSIPTVTQTIREKYQVYETYELDLADDFLGMLASDAFNLQPVGELVTPRSKNGLAEFGAYQRLTAQLPLHFQSAPVEGLPYDCIVDGKRWQLKLAGLNEPTDRYVATAQKQAGRVGGKRKHTQYAAADFDFLCVQLPEQLQLAYLIPMKVLVEKGLANRMDRTNATLHFYPHRSSRLKSTWINTYKIDLSSHQQALSDYRQIMSGSEQFV